MPPGSKTHTSLSYDESVPATTRPSGRIATAFGIRGSRVLVHLDEVGRAQDRVVVGRTRGNDYLGAVRGDRQLRRRSHRRSDCHRPLDELRRGGLEADSRAGLVPVAPAITMSVGRAGSEQRRGADPRADGFDGRSGRNSPVSRSIRPMPAVDALSQPQETQSCPAAKARSVGQVFGPVGLAGEQPVRSRRCQVDDREPALVAGGDVELAAVGAQRHPGGAGDARKGAQDAAVQVGDDRSSVPLPPVM